jgi:Flp pilus assembly protein TadD
MARGTAKAPPIDALNFRNRLTAMVPSMKAAEAAGGEVAAQIKAKRDEAVTLVRQALNLDPRSAPSYSDLGVYLLRTGDEPAARTALEKSL